jgi:hypothetical protein
LLSDSQVKGFRVDSVIYCGNNISQFHERNWKIARITDRTTQLDS